MLERSATADIGRYQREIEELYAERLKKVGPIEKQQIAVQAELDSEEVQEDAVEKYNEQEDENPTHRSTEEENHPSKNHEQQSKDSIIHIESEENKKNAFQAILDMGAKLFYRPTEIDPKSPLLPSPETPKRKVGGQDSTMYHSFNEFRPSLSSTMNRPKVEEQEDQLAHSVMKVMMKAQKQDHEGAIEELV
uniref:CCDC50_N domain-containing protein n=1 Tax=Strongyloides papillosus TaxID=174720 RepID=A0A0N5B5M8_STREA